MNRRWIFLAVLFTATGLSRITLRHLGQWLELDESLQRSPAIIVFGGSVPFRAMEAVSIYQARRASAVWLRQGSLYERDAVLI
jgi:hypothetical protein